MLLRVFPVPERDTRRDDARDRAQHALAACHSADARCLTLERALNAIASRRADNESMMIDFAVGVGLGF